MRGSSSFDGVATSVSQFCDVPADKSSNARGKKLSVFRMKALHQWKATSAPIMSSRLHFSLFFIWFFDWKRHDFRASLYLFFLSIFLSPMAHKVTQHQSNPSLLFQFQRLTSPLFIWLVDLHWQGKLAEFVDLLILWNCFNLFQIEFKETRAAILIGYRDFLSTWSASAVGIVTGDIIGVVRSFNFDDDRRRMRTAWWCAVVHLAFGYWNLWALLSVAR